MNFNETLTGGALRPRIAALAIVFLMASPAASLAADPVEAPEAAEEKNIDPFESINRVTFAVNETFDRYIMRPIGKGYNAVLPQPVRTGVGNFFQHWRYPVVIVNSFLQGEFRQGAEDVERFVVNSTVGVLGVLDPATKWDIERHEEDFGLTFARWGIPQGPYVVIPLLGPATARSGIGILGNVQINPIVQYNDTSVRDKMLILWYVETRAALIGPDEVVREAYDPYLFMRDAYLQNRTFLRLGIDEDNPFFEDTFEDFDDDF